MCMFFTTAVELLFVRISPLGVLTRSIPSTVALIRTWSNFMDYLVRFHYLAAKNIQKIIIGTFAYFLQVFKCFQFLQNIRVLGNIRN